jgi:hypothetical protein
MTVYSDAFRARFLKLSIDARAIRFTKMEENKLSPQDEELKKRAMFELQEINRQQGIDDLTKFVQNKERLEVLFEQFVREQEQKEFEVKKAKFMESI